MKNLTFILLLFLGMGMVANAQTAQIITSAEKAVEKMRISQTEFSGSKKKILKQPLKKAVYELFQLEEDISLMQQASLQKNYTIFQRSQNTVCVSMVDGQKSLLLLYEQKGVKKMHVEIDAKTYTLFLEGDSFLITLYNSQYQYQRYFSLNWEEKSLPRNADFDPSLPGTLESILEEF
jgi:hypothetical protein